MKPYLSDPDVTLWHGDCLDVLRALPDASVDCIATSPPFFGLRDYGVEGQIGLEPTPNAWASRLVDVFREARRVLADHGTLWIECGDSYVSGQGGRQSAVGELPPTTRMDRGEPGERPDLPNPPGSWSDRNVSPRFYPGRDTKLKPKDLLGTPFLLAFALRADGWWWRGVNIWAKPNPLPESVRDRTTVAHSYVLHFAKRPRYFFDAEAVREPAAWERWGDQTVVKEQQGKGSWIPAKSKDALRAERLGSAPSGYSGNPAVVGAKGHPLPGPWTEGLGRNLRSVWTIATEGFPEAHFATWPTKLAEQILKAACPEQVCRVCGKPRERVVDVSYEKSPVHGAGSVVGRHEESGQNNYDGAGMPRVSKVTQTLGFTDCGHNDDYRPGVVLDPFGGSGTTALVARKLGRSAVLIELNEDYCAMAARRLQQLSLLAAPIPEPPLLAEAEA